MVFVPLDGDERVNAVRLAGADILGAVKTSVRQQLFHLAQRFRQCRQLLEHRHHLFLVVAGLGDGRGDDQHGGSINRSLGVVRLFKVVAGDRHDPGFTIGQIELVLRPRSSNRWFRRLAARFPAAFLGLLFATRQLSLVLGLFLLKAHFGTRLYLDLRRGHGLQSRLAAGDFFWQIHAIQHRRLVGLLRHRQQRLDFRFELDFQLLDVAV